MNLGIALALVAASWYATVRLLAWSATRPERRLPGKALPQNRLARARQFVHVVHLPRPR